MESMQTEILNEIISQNHNRNCHFTLGPGDKLSYKCDNCKSLHPTREQLFEHITNKHTKCTMWAKVLQTSKYFENNNKLSHHKPTLKNTLEKEPILKILKTKSVI